MLQLINQVFETLGSGPVPVLAYVVLAGIVFAESGLFFGFFLPGDSLLFAVGALSAVAPGKPFNILILLPLVFIAAVLGDNVGYWFGKKTGPKIFSREDSRFFKKHYLLTARAFYEKHGGKAIVLARFVPFVRTFAPIVAGAVEMHYRDFVFYNLLGGFIWAIGATLAGFFFGQIPLIHDNFELAVVAIILVSVAPIGIHWLSDKLKERAEARKKATDALPSAAQD